MADRSVKITVGANVNPLKSAMADGAKSVDKLGSSATTLGQKLKKGLGFVGLTGGVLSLGAAIKGVFTLGLDFTTQLNTLQAVTGATGAQMADVSEKAKQLGNDISIPATSAGDAAQAMTELAKGGLSVSQSMEAAKGTLQLAAAAQISGAQAAEIQANALNTFGLKASDASHVADVLANTANAASGEITDFAQAMTQVGPVAKGFGVSIDDTSTMLALFAKNGLLGSQAGTTLRSMLIQLATPTDKSTKAMAALGLTIYDQQGKFVGLRSLTDQLAQAQGRMTQQAFQSNAALVFGTYGINGASIAASEGAASFDTMGKAVGRVGGAADLANAKMKGLPGALQQVQNAAETLAINIYQRLSPSMETLALGFANLIDLVGPALTAVFGAAFGAIGLGISVIGKLATVFGSLPGPIQAFAVALAALAIANKIGLISSLGSAFDGVRLRAMYAGDAIKGMSFSSITTGARAAGSSMMAAFGGPIGLAIAGVTLGVTLLSSAFGGNSSSAQETKAHVDDLTQAYIANGGAIDDNIRSSVAKRLEDDGLLKQAAALGISLSTVTDAALGNAGATDRITAAAVRAAAATIASSESYKNARVDLDAAGISAVDMASAVLTGGGTATEASKKWKTYIDSLNETQRGSVIATDAQSKYSRVMHESADASGQYADVLQATGAEARNNAEAQASAARQTEASTSSTQDLSDSWDRAGGAMAAAGSVAAGTASDVDGLSSAVSAQVSALQTLLNVASQTRTAISGSLTGFVSPVGAYDAAKQTANFHATQSSGGGGGGGGGGGSKPSGPSPLVAAATSLADQAKKDRDAIDARYKDMLDVTKARYEVQLAAFEKARDAVKAAADEAQKSAEAFLSNAKDRASSAADEAAALSTLAGFGTQGSTLSQSLQDQAVAQAKLNVAQAEQVSIQKQLSSSGLSAQKRAELQDRLNTLIAQQTSLQAVAAAADLTASQARTELAKTTNLSTDASTKALAAMQLQATAAAEVVVKDQAAAQVTADSATKKQAADDKYTASKTANDAALKALQDKRDTDVKAAEDRYQKLLDAKNASETVSKASSVSHGGGVSGAAKKMAEDAAPSFAQYMGELQKQVTAQTNWKNNIVDLASRVGPDVAIELAKMGPQAAPMIQMLADQTDTTLNTKWVPLFKKSTAAGTQSILDELTKALDPTGKKGLQLGDAVITGLQDALKAAKDDPAATAAIQAVIAALQTTATNNPLSLEVKLKLAQAQKDLERFTGDKGIASWAKTSGARANGGPVMSGQSYLIGERGAEILTMTGGGNGHVLSASQSQPILRDVASAGGGRGSMDMVVTIRGSDAIGSEMARVADVQITTHDRDTQRMNVIINRTRGGR